MWFWLVLAACVVAAVVGIGALIVRIVLRQLDNPEKTKASAAHSDKRAITGPTET